MTRRAMGWPVVTATTAFVSALTMLALALPAAASPPTPATRIWTVTPTPNPGGQLVSDISFTGVSASGISDAWAVGIDQIGAFRLPLAERWGGRAWHAVPAPRPSGRQAWFNGVAELSANDVWAVGASSSSQDFTLDERTLIEHWDGTSWTIIPSPNPATGGASGDVLAAIAAVGPDDLWATGWVHDDALMENVLLFEHFDGKAWTAAPTPSPLGAEQFGTAIAAVSSNDVWAVGDQALQQTLAAHWDGTRWSIVSTPSLQDGVSPINELTGVTATASNDVWASGYEGNVNDKNFMKPYLLHWNGTTWSLVLAPNRGGEGSRLNATAALSATDVWAVGQTQLLDGTILTLSERFDGNAWTIVPSPSPQGNQLAVDSLTSIAGGVGALVTVGAREIPGQCCLRTLALATRQG